MRLKGSDADAIGKPVPDATAAQADPGEDLEASIWRTLATCYDPEIPVDIVELGLVYAAISRRCRTTGCGSRST